MPPPESIPRFVDAAASVVVVLVLLVATWRVAAHYLPFKIPLRPVLYIFLVLGGITGVETLARESPEALVGGWLGLGLIAFLVRRHLATAETREKYQQRLQQARGHERRRAPPPLPGGTHHQPPSAGGTP